MRIRVSKQEVMLDQLVYDAHGSDQGGRVEAALALNRGLAERLALSNHALDLDAVIILTEPTAIVPVLPTVKLWD